MGSAKSAFLGHFFVLNGHNSLFLFITPFVCLLCWVVFLSLLSMDQRETAFQLYTSQRCQCCIEVVHILMCLCNAKHKQKYRVLYSTTLIQLLFIDCLQSWIWKFWIMCDLKECCSLELWDCTGCDPYVSHIQVEYDLISKQKWCWYSMVIWRFKIKKTLLKLLSDVSNTSTFL